MGSKKSSKRKDGSGKKSESFNPAHKKGGEYSNYKKKVRGKKNKEAAKKLAT